MKQYLRIFCFYFQNDWCRWFFITNFVVKNHYFEIIDCFSFFVNHDWHFRMNIEFFVENNFFRFNKTLQNRLKINFNVERMNEINKKLQFQMIYVQIWYKNMLIVIANMLFVNKLKIEFFSTSKNLLFANLSKNQTIVTKFFSKLSKS